MTLEQQVCTLEQAKRLMELGIDKYGLFVYFENIALKADKGLLYYRDTASYRDFDKIQSRSAIRYYPAFTVAELGQMCNSETYTQRTGSEDSEYANWEWMDEGNEKGMGLFETEAQARAAMLIHLLENKLVTATDCNNRLIN